MRNVDGPMAEQTTEKAPGYNTEDPKSMLTIVEQAQVGRGDFWNKKDVQNTCDHGKPDNTADVSIEGFIFDKEASFGYYT